MVQLSHLYVTTGKTIALTIWTFVSKEMSLLLNTEIIQIICVIEVIDISPGNFDSSLYLKKQGNNIYP